MTETICLAALFVALGGAASEPPVSPLAKVLSAPILEKDTSLEDMQRVFAGRIPPLKLPATAEKWDAEARELRRRMLDNVVLDVQLVRLSVLAAIKIEQAIAKKYEMLEAIDEMLEEEWAASPVRAPLAYETSIRPAIDILSRQNALAGCAEAKRYYERETQRLRDRTNALRLRAAVDRQGEKCLEEPPHHAREMNSATVLLSLPSVWASTPR